MAKIDPDILAHQEWIGFVRPTGLVVSAHALVRAGAILDRRDMDGQRLLQNCVKEKSFEPGADPAPYLPSFQTFAESVLDWNFSPQAYAGTDQCPIPPELEIPLPGYAETLRPDFAVRELDPKEGALPWQLLIGILDLSDDFDFVVHRPGQLDASPHGRMERLLRRTGVTAGLLFNGRAVRLLSAPYGESSGWIDFRVANMVQTAGRPITSALRLLLSQPRLLSLPRSQRLTALLEDSRKFQNEVSESLAEQVLHALYELLRGFQAAHDASKGVLLKEPLTDHPDEVYRGLLTVLLRFVFMLFAEERDMLPEEETFIRYYSLAGLYERLREDAALYPDTMDQRFGAWAQLLVLFRMVYDGAASGAMRLPSRHGVLFDPDRYPFLEGRTSKRPLDEGGRIEPPLVPDGTIYRALEKLLVLNGERISYRALDVEQIGSVYETIMGFRLETATGLSLAVKAQKKHGAPSAINLEALLDEPAAKREKWVRDRTDRKLTDKVKKAVQEAGTLEDLHAALMPVVDVAATPDLVTKGAMVLQPSEERRRSGSHYTPRSLTQPIVRTTLEPILARLRGVEERPPRPAQILELKICDPAMGSGAFLVEACRQLGDALVESWHSYEELPRIPPDEDEVIFARRLIAQRCLYGVDKNPVAVDLAKVSLWLATLAKEHPLTFLDHCLRCGDSLVGLTRKQIADFHWLQVTQRVLGQEHLEARIEAATKHRALILNARDEVEYDYLRQQLAAADEALEFVRFAGDLCVAAYFAADKDAKRKLLRDQYLDRLTAYLRSGDLRQRPTDLVDALRHPATDGVSVLFPFHWEIEYPEVFQRDNPGFDAFVGNPPFAGHVSVVGANRLGYTEWMRELHPESTGKCDIVAHFFRRTFNLLRQRGCQGLIATNTISQGDTRTSGLRWICHHGGVIYAARRRMKWPGLAAVVVSVLHVIKETDFGPTYLDDRRVEKISAFLFHRGGSDDPMALSSTEKKCFQGSIALGMGFTFDDDNSKYSTTSLSEMRRLIEFNPRNKEVIFPYVGGEELNSSPTHAHSRYIIDFGSRAKDECQRKWPELFAIVEAKVRPERLKSARDSKSSHGDRASIWWQHYHQAKDLYAAIANLERVIAMSRIGQYFAFAFLSPTINFSNSLNVFSLSTDSAFCALQSRPHEIWARFFGSSLEDRLRYTPSDCFETYPFPQDWQSDPRLEAIGKTYYEFRAALMMKNNEGLTKTYNRFHDPEERDPDILKLRELHAAMDRAVFDAYGWHDIPTTCQFLLDYEIDEEEDAGRKKPYRYRWPDEVRDEVLARLLELNAQRAAEEVRSGAAAAKMKKAGGPGKKRKTAGPETGELFS